MADRHSESNASRAARRIGDATRAAQELLDGTARASSDRGTTQLEATLRNLVDAITAVWDHGDPHSPTPEEQAFAIRGGVPASAFTDNGVRQIQDWLAWSALVIDNERRTPDALADRTIFDIVPGLREVIAAFPDDYLDLNRFTFLTTPHEALDGLPPLRWLLLGRDSDAVDRVVDDLNYLP